MDSYRFPVGREIIHIHEVGLRDGLQNEAAFVPTEDKCALASTLADAGLKRLEVTSFVSPKWIPQMADHAAVARCAPRRAGLTLSALVPNLRGLQGAIAANLDEVAVFLSATETHSKRNINKSVDDAIAVLSEVTQEALAEGLQVRGYVSTVFGCPYEGAVPVAQVVRVTEALFRMGAHEVSLGDTIGVADPGQVRALLDALRPQFALESLALHMHDTRGTALANVLAGLDGGIRIFDAAFGGLGGCPYAPGASGNLATEDLVYMLERMGFDTGVDLKKLVAASIRAERLLGRRLPSKVLQAERAHVESTEEAASSASQSG